MKNLFKLSSLLFVGLVLFQISCSDDPAPEVVIPDPTGKWQLKTATLVDGNTLTAEADPLVVEYYPVASIPVGDVENTTTLVGGALAGTVCELQESYGSFFLELTADGKIVFYCQDEGIVSTDPNTWSVISNNDEPPTYNLVLNVVVGGNALPITINNFDVTADGSTLSGQAAGYPMVKSLAVGISPDNIQFITTDMVFSKFQ